jgi:hypothetical protein
LCKYPAIERNGFGAVKAYTASSLSLRESGEHLVSLDQCIAAMKKTGLDRSKKYKETSLGGLQLALLNAEVSNLVNIYEICINHPCPAHEASDSAVDFTRQRENNIYPSPVFLP